MWDVDPAPNSPNLFIVQGLASAAVYEHALYPVNHSAITPDVDWLQTASPSLYRTAMATKAARATCDCDGLMPKAGGDGGLPTGHIFVQENGALHGLRVAR